MTISVWRYSHLALALSSFLLIVLASITGIILAFEPVSLKMSPYKVDRFQEITLAEALPAIKSNFEEITELTVDANQFVTVKGIDLKGEDVTVYVDSRTGKTLGIPAKQSEFFQWVTALHRSLFLHEAGRFFIGLTTFLLLLISLSGIILIIQRQRGIKRFFTKIVKESFAQYYHVTLGRLLLIPILIITISGTYLSLARFKLIPEEKIVEQKIDFDQLKETPKRKLKDIDIFKKTHLADVSSIEFPFSVDVEDYYTLKLKDRELTINQVTGDILTEVLYPTTVILTELSLDLHTGRTNIIWAIVLAIACCNILFFIYSGFAITLKRISGKVKNKYKKEDCEYIILVGSENGSTFRFAKVIYQALLKNGKKCYLTELNNYTVFPKAEQLIVITATYGLGDPPTNSGKFIDLLKKYPQPQKVQFSVVGMGSKAYPDFCKYAYEVNNAIAVQHWAEPLVEIHTVDDKSPSEFMQWISLWEQKTEIPLEVNANQFQVRRRLSELTVTAKTAVTGREGSFLISLKPKHRLKVTSGDLLAVYPANDHRERLYSIGCVHKQLQLSIKLHEQGLGSNYLHQLKIGDTIKASVNVNRHFHMPTKANTVIMIANGTGIAPFLGMIDQNTKKVSCQLYCGFKSSASFELYQEALQQNLADHKLESLKVAYSREGNRQYVNNLVARDQEKIAKAMNEDGVIMICGSLAMQKDVIELLNTVFESSGNEKVSYYQSHGRILMDCY
jgi:sulfite reductase (NADPH) flavoprotein alpha-component